MYRVRRVIVARRRVGSGGKGDEVGSSVGVIGGVSVRSPVVVVAVSKAVGTLLGLGDLAGGESIFVICVGDIGII